MVKCKCCENEAEFDNDYCWECLEAKEAYEQTSREEYESLK